MGAEKRRRLFSNYIQLVEYVDEIFSLITLHDTHKLLSSCGAGDYDDNGDNDDRVAVISHDPFSAVRRV